MTTSDTRYRLIVAGRLSQTVTELIDSRFGSAASVSTSGPDSSVELTADQPALRALLTLLWDLGHEIVAILQPRTGSEASDASVSPSTSLDAYTGSGPGSHRVPTHPCPKERTPHDRV